MDNITLPSSLTHIGSTAFFNCRSLVSIDLPSSVTAIGSSAFNYCASLTSFVFPSSLKKVLDLFSNCVSLASVTIPSSVTYIGDYFLFFSTGPNLVVTLEHTDPNSVTLGSGVFDLVSKNIKIPSAALAAFKAHSKWKKWKDKMVGY